MVTLRSYVTADSCLDKEREIRKKKSIQNIKKIKLTRSPIQYLSQDQKSLHSNRSRFKFELNQKGVLCGLRR